MDMTSAPAKAGTNPSTRKPSPRAPVIRLVSMNMSALTPFPGGDLQITEASASRNRIRSSRVARNGL
jgi:hypothetical protein